MHKVRDSDFGVSFRISQAALPLAGRWKKAHRMAAEALALHIAGRAEDGETIPEPSTLDALGVAKAGMTRPAYMVQSALVARCSRLGA